MQGKCYVHRLHDKGQNLWRSPVLLKRSLVKQDPYRMYRNSIVPARKIYRSFSSRMLGRCDRHRSLPWRNFELFLLAAENLRSR